MGQYNWQLCFSSMCNIGNGHAGTYNSNGNDGKYNNFDVGPRENHLHLGISIETCAIKHRTKIEIDCMKELVFGNDRQQTLKRTKHFGLFNSLFRKYSYGIVGRHCRPQEESHCVMIWDKVKECIRLAPRPIPILPIIGRGICHKSHDQCR